MVNIIERTFGVLEEIGNVGGRNDKIAILESEKDNEILKEIFMMAYNPFTKYHVNKYGDVNPSGEGISLGRFTKFSELLTHLNRRVFTGHEALGILQSFFNECSPEEHLWYDRILKKDLRIGVSISTINKVWDKYIPIFDCMLAKPWHKVKNKPEVVFVEPKLDGYRAVCFVNEDGSVELMTRNGRLMEGFTDIELELSKLPKGRMYDAEITGKNDAFNEMQKSVFNKRIKEKHGDLNIFDTITIEEFKNGEGTQPLHERVEYLSGELTELVQELELNHINIVKQSEAMRYDDPKVDELYQKYLNSGYEGVMVKDINSVYECKRTNSWLKIKPVETFDLEVVGYEEGQGKYEGMLGAFIVEYNGFKVNVGTGTALKDKDRKEFWSIKDELVGKVIEIEAQEVTENQKGEQSIRFPSFKGIRLDK